MEVEDLNETRIANYREFWPFYLSEHSRAGTRALHLAGTLVALAVALTAAFTGHWRWIPLALVPGYGFAWIGHYFIEHNRPATFKYPLWSFISDYKMVGLMLSGRLPNEIRRVTRL